MKPGRMYTYGDPEAENLLIQMVDEHDLEVIEQEVSLIRELSQEKSFCLTAVKVQSWNNDLSPWAAPAVFGDEGFGGGASDTLAFLTEEWIPQLKGASRSEKRKLYIGGYSLAGLFALWAVYQTDLFSGAAAASPSVWFPSFTEYMRNHPIRTDAVYLSLGDKEEKTKNPVMSRVGDAIREGYAILQAAGCDSVLEWNAGNHFKEPDLRTAKAFAWLLRK